MSLASVSQQLLGERIQEETLFIVMKGRNQNLIGRKSAKAFGMVTFNLDGEPENEPNVNQVATKTELSKDELASMYPQLFSGKLGCIKNIEVKLEVDENVKKSSSLIGWSHFIIMTWSK